MTPIRQKVIAAKVSVIREMMAVIDTLPLGSLDQFLEDRLTPPAGESLLRRALEALLDIGRHILAKGFGAPVAEYGKIGESLHARGVLSSQRAAELVAMGRYRNRLTHFYDEVTPEELFTILTTHLEDLTSILDELLEWLRTHPEMVDTSL